MNDFQNLINLIDIWYPQISDTSHLPYVPLILEKRGGECCSSINFASPFIANIFHHGYLPMGLMLDRIPLLLIKSHQRRCVLKLQNLHISRKTKNYAKGLTVQINKDFTHCLHTIKNHHQQEWLIQPLCNALIDLHQQSIMGVSLHSLGIAAASLSEVYEGNKLVAGEIGYTTGAIYTSLAGFHRQNGSGSVQLAILGLLLIESGFALWDLGMEIPYKLSLGADVVHRKTFLEIWKRYRHRTTPDWSVNQLKDLEMIPRLKRQLARQKNTPYC